MIEPLFVQKIYYRSGTAGFFVSGGYDNAGDTRLNYCSGAHRAGLKGNIHGAVLKPPVVLIFTRLFDRDDLRMGEYRVIVVPFVVAPAIILLSFTIMQPMGTSLIKRAFFACFMASFMKKRSVFSCSSISFCSRERRRVFRFSARRAAFVMDKVLLSFHNLDTI